MVNPQKKGTITPDVMLNTKNVMIPVVKPVPGKQSFNVLLSKNRPRILRATNYKNNPALLFTETPSHVLYDPLRNLLEVKRLNNMRFKNQSTKYTISKKANCVSMKRSGISQNLCLSKKLSNYGKTNCTLYFPNTIPVRLEVSTKDLKKASLKSIELSRKCNLSQIKHIPAKCKDKFAIMPKIEAQISDNMSQTPNISFSSQSFYNTTDTASETSASVPSFRKEAFVNIQDREKSMSRIASNQLQSINSECEINVLHYENDAPSEDCIAHLLQHHLKSIKTNSSIDNASSVKTQDNDNDITDEKNKIKNYHEWNVKIPDIKYSWEIDSWMPFSQRKEYNDTHEIKNIDMTYRKKPYECKIKYSWQVIGISTQTSHSLLQDLMDNIDVDKSAYKMCSIKYSWQIIGISTQASLDDHNDPNYWEGVLLSPNKNCDNLQIDNNEMDCIKLRDHRIKCKERGLRRYLILNNQETQTFAEKEAQTDVNDYCAKYSWHDLTKRYIYGTNFRSADQSESV